MRYIDFLDYEFVRVFGEKLGLKNFHVRETLEGWHLNFDYDSQMPYNILIGNYIVCSRLGKEFCDNATKLWRIEMFKKFGKRYLRDVKRFETLRLRRNFDTQKAILNERLQNIKKESLER